MYCVIECFCEIEEIDCIIIVGILYKNVYDCKEKYFLNEVKNVVYICFFVYEFVLYIDENYLMY